MKGPARRSPEERFWPRVNKNGPLWNGTPCWLWTGAKNKLGYGRFSLGGWHGKLIGAHVFAYVQLVGPIPDGLEPDHLCRNPSCVNPAHLEPVTHSINLQRGLTGKIKNPQTAKTHCPKGHPYDYVNRQGKRECRTCHREQTRLRRGSIKRRRSPYYDGGEP